MKNVKNSNVEKRRVAVFENLWASFYFMKKTPNRVGGDCCMMLSDFENFTS